MPPKKSRKSKPKQTGKENGLLKPLKLATAKNPSPKKADLEFLGTTSKIWRSDWTAQKLLVQSHQSALPI
jgi:hypothetical protein